MVVFNFSMLFFTFKDQDMEDKVGGDKHRRGLFKLSGFRFTFKGRNRKSHLGFRSETDKGNVFADDYNYAYVSFKLLSVI